MAKFIQIVTTFKTHDEAMTMSAKILEEGLVACAHISEIQSHYKFEGELHHHKEFQLSMITRDELYKQCEGFIKKNHPYKVPQIIATKIKHGHHDYLNWVFESSTKRPKGALALRVLPQTIDDDS